MPHSTPVSFVVAMRASVALAGYSVPFRPERRLSDWLIVSRWGANAEHLTIAFSGVAAEETAPTAPLGLVPRATVLGLLAWEDLGAAESIFLLLRRRPQGIPLAGEFLPAEGFARVAVTAGSGALRLAAAGRHAHRAAHDSMTAPEPVSADGATPVDGDWPAAAMRGLSWRISAKRRPWLGEATGWGEADADDTMALADDRALHGPQPCNDPWIGTAARASRPLAEAGRRWRNGGAACRLVAAGG